MNFDKLLDGLIWFLSAFGREWAAQQRETESNNENYLFNLRFACLFNQFLCLLATIIFLSVSHHGR
jgi:hypothetical protein